MGMVGILRRAGEPDLQRLLREPGLVLPFLHGEEFDPPPPKRGFFARLFGRRAPAPPPAPDPPFQRTEDDEMDVDKAWHGLHYLFTGTAWAGEEPAAYLVQGGEEIAGVDVGFGTARVIRPAQVKAFADFLHPLTREGLLSRYDPAEMRELDIYPPIWNGEDLEIFDYLWENLQFLRAFVATAAERGDGLVIYLG